MEFPSIKTFVTLSPMPAFHKWLGSEKDEELEGLDILKAKLKSSSKIIGSDTLSGELLAIYFSIYSLVCILHANTIVDYLFFWVFENFNNRIYMILAQIEPFS